MTTAKHLDALYARLVGRTIVSVASGAFARDFIDEGETPHTRGGFTSDPRFVFDDGSTLSFVVDETEVGEYGLYPVINPRTKRKPRKKP